MTCAKKVIEIRELRDIKMDPWRYKISLSVFKNIAVEESYFLIAKWPFNVLFIILTQTK